jgi:DNA polymerase-4
LLKDLPTHKIPGIGEKLAGELKALGVTVVSDILKFTPEFWVKRLGKSGAEIYERAQGRGSDQVAPHREPKSFGAEDTFPRDLEDPEELTQWLLHQAETVGGELRRKGCRGRTITLKIKYSDFRVKTRGRPDRSTCSTRSLRLCTPASGRAEAHRQGSADRDQRLQPGARPTADAVICGARNEKAR